MKQLVEGTIATGDRVFEQDLLQQLVALLLQEVMAWMTIEVEMVICNLLVVQQVWQTWLSGISSRIMPVMLRHTQWYVFSLFPSFLPSHLFTQSPPPSISHSRIRRANEDLVKQPHKRH
jgi:hypothetical protein